MAGSYSAAAYIVWIESYSRCSTGINPGTSVSLDWLFFGGNLFRHTFGNDIGGTDQRKYWLRFLYQYNLINIVLGGIIRGIL